MNSLQPDTKWLIGLLLPLIGTCFAGVYYLGSMSARFEGVEGQMKKVNGTIETLIKDDIADIKRRMAVMESKDILPRASREIEELDKRLRALEAGKGSN